MNDGLEQCIMYNSDYYRTIPDFIYVMFLVCFNPFVPGNILVFDARF